MFKQGADEFLHEQLEVQGYTDDQINRMVADGSARNHVTEALEVLHQRVRGFDVMSQQILGALGLGPYAKSENITEPVSEAEKS